MARIRRKRFHAPGTTPGTLVAHAEASGGPVRIARFAYGASRCEERAVDLADIPSLAVPGDGVLWLDVVGLSDPAIVKAIGDRFGFHPLALEDVLNIPQRFIGIAQSVEDVILLRAIQLTLAEIVWVHLRAPKQFKRLCSMTIINQR